MSRLSPRGMTTPNLNINLIDDANSQSQETVRLSLPSPRSNLPRPSLPTPIPPPRDLQPPPRTTDRPLKRWGSNASSRHPHQSQHLRSNHILHHDAAGVWTTFSRIVTGCIPSFVLRWCGMSNEQTQQAWREKITLVGIIVFLCGAMGFVTFLLQLVLCSESNTGRVRYKQLTKNQVVISGIVYDMSKYVHPQVTIDDVTFEGGFQLNQKPQPDAGSKDLSFLFQTLTRKNPGSCKGVLTVQPTGEYERYFPCVPIDYYSTAKISGNVSSPSCHFNKKPAGRKFNKYGDMYFTWDDVANPDNKLIVYGGNVLDLGRLELLTGDVSLVQEVLDLKDPKKPYLGRDVSYYLSNEFPEVGKCLKELLRVGMIDTNTIGCITTQIIQYITLVIIIGVVLAKFFMAILFGWVLSWRLGALNESNYRDKLQKYDQIEAWLDDDEDVSSTSSPGLEGSPIGSPLSAHQNNEKKQQDEDTKKVISDPQKELGFHLHHTIQLVTCYSEGLSSIKTTLDSIANSNYPKNRQLIFVIADGIITGAGNEMNTPDLCLSLMEDFIIPPELVQPHTYVAIAEGSKRTNMAKVYAGYYYATKLNPGESKLQRIPMILVAKCGLKEEVIKPGNRGKRDSQVLLMSFLQKAIFDDRMTELEYELFNAVWNISGVTPDAYETVLMVDADTAVYPDALTRMVACFARDPRVMGLCGETKIANKKQSWVTAIQVFEYYISHHLSKAFESIFGGVTCLPGCFSMYRIKAPKGNSDWVPILCNPDILQQYSENVVTTLHQKNLLLLGEDRYLTTLMLRTFPKRKLIFVPQAVCKTVVPDSFSVLLSQRRRWINSTVHNLLELVITRDLCGTFCFSMQFIVFMELLGTAVLPAAICFTIYLLTLTAVMKDPPVIPLIILAMILGLPAILIVMTTRKVSYLMWMGIYLLSLPIWNFVLPVYAFWHFDDFSWGQTRQITGEDPNSHAQAEGEFDANQIVMNRWADFEREKRRSTVKILTQHGQATQLPTAILNDPTKYKSTTTRPQTYPSPHLLPNSALLDQLGYLSPTALHRISRVIAAEEDIPSILTDTNHHHPSHGSPNFSLPPLSHPPSTRALPWRSQQSLSFTPTTSRLSLSLPHHPPTAYNLTAPSRSSIFDPTYSPAQK